MKATLRGLAIAAVFIGTAGTAFAAIDFTYGGRNYDAVADVTLTWDGQWHGGHFGVNLLDGSLGVPTPFNTFCVESDITFYPGATYAASIDTWSARGLASNPPGGKVDLTPEAAWIYCEYYHYGNTFSNGATWTDRQISQAIWYWMRQPPGDDLAVYNDLARYAENLDLSDIGCTRVMNLWTLVPDGAGGYTVGDVQSQLICIPAPAAALLGAIGLGLVGWAKRRLS